MKLQSLEGFGQELNGEMLSRIRGGQDVVLQTVTVFPDHTKNKVDGDDSDEDDDEDQEQPEDPNPNQP